MAYEVEITKPDGTTERIPIQGGQVTLGKSMTAGIPVPAATELELEHLLLAPRGKEGCWVSTTQNARTPTLHKNKSFDNGLLTWGSELVVGRVKIRLLEKTALKDRSKTSVSPVLLLALVAGVAFLGYSLLGGGAESVPTSEGLTAPELFAEETATCPLAGASAARDLEYTAHSRADRVHFDFGDGVLAVSLFHQAAACYRALPDGDPKAAQLTNTAAALQQSLEGTYHATILRLERALGASDWREAARQAARLQELTQHLSREDPYLVWLRDMRRIVEARADTPEAE